jgi:hypothetical protein
MDELRKPTGRPEALDIAIIDDTSGYVIGIRYCLDAVVKRSGERLTQEDFRELNTILDLVNAIQEDYLRLRALVSERYQAGERQLG